MHAKAGAPRRTAAISPPPSCASRLKVLADETRLAVIQQLFAGPKHVADMNAELHMDQSLLSHHLKVLREAKLVVARRDGKAVLYALAPGVAAANSGRSVDFGCCQLSFE